MNRIDATFRRLRARGEAALIPYFPVGFPTAGATLALIQAAAEAGADLIELGVPFSDPLADGPTVQEAGRVALRNGTTVHTCLAAVAAARRAGVRLPLVLMSYVNPLLAYGVDRLVADFAAVGGDGLIIPDLPSEAAGEWREPLKAARLPLVPMIAPTTEPERAARVAAGGGGFAYCVSVTGVTGARADLSSELEDFLVRTRAVTDLPLAVGFGIATPEHVRFVAARADGAVVGSALLDAIRADPTPARVTGFLRPMKAATRNREGT